MVQLKAYLSLHVLFSHFRFNSSMVQLKEYRETNLRFLNRMFQFLYGTIKRCGKLLCYVSGTGFNSSMVQLKAGKYQQNNAAQPVSIPLWYN